MSEHPPEDPHGQGWQPPVSPTPGGQPAAPQFQPPPGYVSQTSPVAPWTQPRPAFATWWSRVGASFLDLIVLVAAAIAFGLIGYLVGGEDAGVSIGLIVWVIAVLFYGPVMIAHNNGATFGKQWSGIKVINQTGQPTGFGRAFCREALAKMLFQLISFVGLIDYLWAAWDKENRCLHDLMASTWVVKDGSLR